MINKILYLFVFVFTVIYCSAQPQYINIEKQIKKADSLWIEGLDNKALKLYIAAFEDSVVSEDIKSMIGMRICENLVKSKRPKECLKFISRLELLEYIPEDHQIRINELKKLLNNDSHTNYQNRINIEHSIIASFHISEKGNITSFEQAVDSVETFLRTNNRKGAIEIVFIDPEYRFTNSLSITNRKISTPGNPLIIRSKSKNSRTSFNGGYRITKWKKEQDEKILALLPPSLRNSIYVADLKENGINYSKKLVYKGYSSKRSNGINDSESMPIPELFYKGEKQTMSRWPDTGFVNADIQKYNNKRTLLWANDNDIWFHGYWKFQWADGYEKLDKIDANGNITLSAPNTIYGYGDAKKDSCKWYVMNTISEISQQGEWKISVSEGKIWYYAPHNFNKNEVVMTVDHWPLSFSGIDNIIFKHIDFKYIQGDALFINNSKNCLVYDCSFYNITGRPLTLNYVKNSLAHSLTIINCGRSGIYHWGGDEKNLTSNESAIINCHIKNFSTIDRTYSPAIHLKGIGTVVENCKFENGPSSAIIAQGKKFIIQKNEFTNCVNESDDQGAIDCWGNPLDRGTVIRHNLFHNIGNQHRMNAAIRLDDVMCGFCISENVFINTSNNVFGSIQINGGQHNRIEGNYFIEKNKNITIANWDKIRWEKAISETGSYSRELKEGYYKDSVWNNIFPKLKNMQVEPNRNYIISNFYSHGTCVINSYANGNSVIFNNNLNDNMKEDRKSVV